MKSKDKKARFERNVTLFFSRKLIILISALFLLPLSGIAQTKTISGKVTDSSGQPIPGANVLIVGTTNGQNSDIEGNYTISAKTGDVLEFSFIGMQNRLVTVGEQNTINVTLSDDIALLSETVVIGYGSARKRDLTGSIVRIKAADVADRPVANPVTSLQGRVAGVQIVNNGRAGQDPEVRIRGTNSLNGFAPLYIVDGLFTDNINFLNPGDIESMEVLKDPSSLAIFGVRGANGVIIISTKRAKEGQTIVNINSFAGLKKVHKRISMTNAAQFKELYNEQLEQMRQNNSDIKPFDYTDWTADTNWQDEIFQTAFVTNNNVSITGATEKNKFYMGLGYMFEEGSIKSEKFSKITVNLSSDYKVSNHFKFGFQFNGSRIRPPDAKGVGAAVLAAPIAPTYADFKDPITKTVERLPHILPSFQSGQLRNPIIDTDVLGNHAIGVNWRGTGNIYGEVSFLKNFKFRTTYSLDYEMQENRSFSPILWVFNPNLSGAPGKENITDRQSVSQSKGTNLTAQSDYILTYDNKFGDHNLTLLGGATTIYRENSSLSGSRYQLKDDIYFNIPNDNNDKWWLSILDSKSMSNGGGQWRRFTMSYLVRALYNYKERYLFNASYRRDGSSVFRNVGNTWDNFYSFGAGWVASEENFMKDISFINYLKVKGSWGVLGNENTGGRAYPSYPGLTSSGSAVFGDEIVTGYTYEYRVKDLGWEKTYAWEAGIELTLLNNRLRVEPTYYHKTTKDIIVQLDAVSGLQNSLENLGEVQNKGFELSASWSDKIGNSGLRYTVAANLTTIKNEVVSIGGAPGDAQYANETRSRTMAGYPIAHFYGYKVEGVYQNYEHIRQSPENKLGTVRPGDLIFADVNGDGVITDKDRTMIGNPTPDLTYGFNINLSYKGFDIGVDLFGMYGNEVYRNWGVSSYAQFNYHTNRLNRWRGEGTSNWEPILDPSRAVNGMPSNYFIEDGSFFRIRNIQLGYTLEPKFLEKLYLKTLRVYANIQDLKTWSKNSSYTPEIGGGALSFGVDNGTYPVPAIYTLGLSLTF